MATAAIDIPYLSSYTSVSEPSLNELIKNPTSDVVTSFLQTLITVAQDHDRLKAERLRQDVELENSVRGGEARVKGLKATADKALQEVESLRNQLNERDAAYKKLENELQSLRSSSTTSTSELQALNAQIKKLEKSNRDTLSLLDNKSTAHDKLAQDLQTQHEKIVSLRREVSSSEERRQAAANDLSNAKFRETSLENEVGLLKRNNEWLDGELKTKTAEYSKYRKDRSAKVSELQRANEDADSVVQSMRRTESNLRARIEQDAQKLDDSYSTNQQLREDLARREDDLRSQSDGARRVADLQKQSLDTARRRVGELEQEVEKVHEAARDEIARLQSEMETERGLREEAEQKIEELEIQLDKIQSSRAVIGNTHSVPGTPRANVNGHGPFGTPGRAGSPIGTPGSARARGGLTFTQMYSEYNNMKSELEASKRRNDKLSATIDEMIHDLEKKEPEIQEQQIEITRLESEVEVLSSQLTEAGQEKDSAKKDSRARTSEMEVLSRETKLLRQQLRDLSTQIRVLLLEAQLQSEGVEYTAADRKQLERLARGEDEEAVMEGMTDTDRFISQRLVSFKNIFQLQENNATLLNLTRTLGEQMEGEEAREKKAQQDQDKVELENLRQRVERYQDEVKSLTVQCQSYVRERNMLKNMLANRGQLASTGDGRLSLGSSVNVPQTPKTPAPGVEQSPGAGDAADFAKAIKEVQNHFDSYRQESAADQSTLRSQLQQLQKDKNDLQSEMARTSSQLTLARERYEMLQSNYTLSRSECEEYQKRAHAHADAAAKQDIRTQQVAEELVEVKGISDSLKNENANLKAEKELWKRVETRLTDDNRSLVEERGRMSKTLTDTQSLYNEREIADSESRRKLQSQVETLESDTRSLTRRLEEATEEAKTANMRREYDQDQNRTRLDDLINSLGQTKEELAAAKTNRDQLQARVDELKIELRSAQEHAQALQPRPTPRPQTSTSNTETQQTNDNTITREQELEIDVSDLRRDLDLAKAELENAKAQVEQYKAISQSAEEELQSLNESHDEYRDDSEKVAAERDARIRELEQRIEDISSEMSNTNNELSSLRTVAEDSNARLAQQKSIYESDIARIKDECERYQETSKFHQEDLKAQAEIAQQAQHSYENEIVKHAEAAKALQKVRSEYNEVKLEITEAKTDAQAARAILSQSEESWSATKDQYEQEILELKRRRDDINGQNKLLHQQLENVGSQIAELQKNRNAGEDDEDVAMAADSGMQNLQEVIKYLRREKEIVDVQYELSVQEAKRFKQQLDYTQSQLDDLRLKFDQERQLHSNQDKSAVSHSKLVETINELNVFRESSVTLRNEARQAQSQLADKTRRVEELISQLEPLQTSIRTFENERETAQGERKLLEEDRDRWQKRTHDILQKYDRIDPAELQSLKDQVSTLEKERDEHAAEQQSIPEQLAQARAEQKASTESEFQDRRHRLEEDLKTRAKQWTTNIKTLKTENANLQETIQNLNKQIEEERVAHSAALTARDQAVAQAPPHTGADAAADSSEEGQVEENGSSIKNSHATSSTAENESAKLSQLQADLQKATEEKVQLQTRVQALEQELETARLNLANLQSNASSDSASQIPELESARSEIQKLKDEITKAKDAPQVTDGSPATSAEDLSAIEDRRKELEDQYNVRKEELEKSYTSRTQNMREQLSKKLAEGKAAYRSELDQKNQETISKLEGELSDARRLAERQEEQTTDSGAATTTVAPSEKNTTETPVATEQTTLSTSSGYQPSEEQVRELIKTNEHVRKLVKARLEKEIGEARSNHTLEMKELQVKAEQAKIQAVELNGKKFNVKMNMLENKARLAVAKNEIVDKAASDTPQKPVVEVWAIAKNYKPPPPAQNTNATPSQPAKTPSVAQPQAPQQPSTDSSTSNVPPSQQQQTPSAVESASTSRPSSSQANAPQPQSGPLAQPPRRLSQSVQGGIPQPVQSRLRRPSQSQPTSHQQAQQQAQQPNGVPATNTADNQNTQGPAARGGLRGVGTQGSGIPRGGTVGRGTGRTLSGSGPAATNNTAQANKLPNRPPQPLQTRGAGSSRGATRGTARGGRGASQPSSPVTAGRGGMNPGARPFAPGANKRPRNESEGPADGANKRTRGGERA